ncbi:hypothetical protein F1737_04725 [Methanoplanus sp. FWC-SCC4]|uniref:Uncharacterized protein n=1 Tax=Methanochimaera problematica TaxID=2609417 RepID=A0AA97FBK1_9EURY|nr:hypothetical protein [Methanoplanus sp. FWC-SCC4]WOF16057.1 hypothetical protein F1737_04725 [Methanoplanus sp. FWC-SCC4]
MKCRAGIAWECEGYINRYLEECGINCDSITPQMMAAPFFKGRLVALVIPTGFANKMYSGLLPALCASENRIRKFVEKGGKVISFGAMSENEEAYKWLPFCTKYVHEYFGSPIKIDCNSPFSEIMEDFNIENIECDGYFTDFDEQTDVIAQTKEGKAIMIGKKYGEGYFIVTSIHEFPSRSFIRNFCTGEAEILF